MGRFCPAPDIHPEVIADKSLDQLSSWIEDCRANHPGCISRKDAGMPSRLLSVIGMDDDDLPILQLHDTDPTQEYEYVALSHVWCFTSPLRTTIASLSAHRLAVPWNELSVGLRETIILTMCLGISS